jgi:acyl-CoA synthetase (AMP-forming)/AMP-acid ligase II
VGQALGERVAIVMANAPVYAELVYACWWAGLAAAGHPPTPTNRLHPRPQRREAALFDADHAETVAAAAREADRRRGWSTQAPDFARLLASGR